MSGNFLSCSKGVKDPFEVQVGRCGLPPDASAEKVPITPGQENFLDFLQVRQVPHELRRGPQGPALVASGKASLHTSCEGPLQIPLQLVQEPKTLCEGEAGN